MAILQKVAADKGIELPNNDELELALYDQLGPPKEENRLPSPSGCVDALSESDHSSDDEPIPTALSEDGRRTRSPSSSNQFPAGRTATAV